MTPRVDAADSNRPPAQDHTPYAITGTCGGGVEPLLPNLKLVREQGEGWQPALFAVTDSHNRLRRSVGTEISRPRNTRG